MRLVRRFPSLLQRIERGEISVSLVYRLRDHLTDENVDELVDATRGRSEHEVDEILAKRRMSSFAPSSLRKLPSVRTSSTLTPVGEAPVAVRQEESRYRMQVTLTREVRDKIERARELLGSTHPTRDLPAVIERAIDALLAELERENEPEDEPEERTPEIPESDVRLSSSKRRKRAEPHGGLCAEVDPTAPECSPGGRGGKPSSSPPKPRAHRDERGRNASGKSSRGKNGETPPLAGAKARARPSRPVRARRGRSAAVDEFHSRK